MQLFYRTWYILRYILRLLFWLSIIWLIIHRIYKSERFNTINVACDLYYKFNSKERYDFIIALQELIKKYKNNIQ